MIRVHYVHPSSRKSELACHLKHIRELLMDPHEVFQDGQRSRELFFATPCTAYPLSSYLELSLHTINSKDWGEEWKLERRERSSTPTPQPSLPKGDRSGGMTSVSGRYILASPQLEEGAVTTSFHLHLPLSHSFLFLSLSLFFSFSNVYLETLSSQPNLLAVL
jgi:hypothetical protein